MTTLLAYSCLSFQTEREMELSFPPCPQPHIMLYLFFIIPRKHIAPELYLGATGEHLAPPGWAGEDLGETPAVGWAVWTRTPCSESLMYCVEEQEAVSWVCMGIHLWPLTFFSLGVMIRTEPTEVLLKALVV